MTNVFSKKNFDPNMEKFDRLVSMKIYCKPMLTMKKTNSNISKELT